MVVRKYDMRGRTIFTKKPFERTLTVFTKGGTVNDFIPTNAPVLIASDPSKKNYAMVIGSIYGEIICMYEFSAYYSESNIEQTNDYCDDVEDYLNKLLSNYNISAFGKEKTILKKGAEYYKSVVVLEAVSKTLQDVARTTTGVNPNEINNWSWKSDQLPDGYRGKTIDSKYAVKYERQGKAVKGSYVYLCEQNPFVEDLSDDLTDVIMIYRYMINNKGSSCICCAENESTKYNYNYTLMDKSKVPPNAVKFIYNKTYSLEKNCNYFVNRSNNLGYCDIDINDLLPIELLENCEELTTHSDVVLFIEKEGNN